MPKKIMSVVGARPQFIKAAVLSRAIATRNGQACPDAGLLDLVVHTGQHYDEDMSEVFFEDLDITPPVVNLGISGGRHGQMTGRMLEALEQTVLDHEPDWVLVHGDTNSTLAGALAATKLHVPVAHVESGLRSWNRRMPEEVNRVVTDAISDVLFVPTATARANLLAEGVPEARIHHVGDVMYDASLHYTASVDAGDYLATHGLRQGSYVLATVHRAENTDDAQRLRSIIEGLRRLALDRPVVLPLHPRTKQALDALGLLADVQANLRVLRPVGYREMLVLEQGAAMVATDSGGVQKEAYFAGVGCLTLRDETEWTELVDAGVNIICGADPDRIVGAAARLEDLEFTPGLYGDGNAGATIIDVLANA